MGANGEEDTSGLRIVIPLISKTVLTPMLVHRHRIPSTVSHPNVDATEPVLRRGGPRRVSARCHRTMRNVRVEMSRMGNAAFAPAFSYMMSIVAIQSASFVGADSGGLSARCHRRGTTPPPNVRAPRITPWHDVRAGRTPRTFVSVRFVFARGSAPTMEPPWQARRPWRAIQHRAHPASR